MMKLNTFSIIARCAESGHLGAAIATCFPGVGAHSAHIVADIGIIVTQGWVNPVLGKEGLQLLKSGKTSNETLNRLMLNDPGRELRQIAVLDYYGNTAAYTGIENDEYKGHIIGKNCSVQGSFLTGPIVLESMLETFESTEGLLENRLLKALEAGQEADGDKRGKQSAVIKVEAIDGFPYVDFRVDDHENPVRELRRIYENNKNILINRYYEWVDAVKQGNKLEA
jgi:uncharacterized Ntn-hydrolase superfamily protein